MDPVGTPSSDGCATNSKSRPNSGWNRCVTRTRRYRSSGQGVIDGVIQCLRGTLRAHRPGRSHRPDADLRRTTSAAGPGRARGRLQRTTTPSQPPALPAQHDQPLAGLFPERIKRRPVLDGEDQRAGSRRSLGQDRWPSSGTPQWPALMVSTYFGEIGDALPVLAANPVEAISLDFVAGPGNRETLGRSATTSRRLPPGA